MKGLLGVARTCCIANNYSVGRSPSPQSQPVREEGKLNAKRDYVMIDTGISRTRSSLQHSSSRRTSRFQKASKTHPRSSLPNLQNSTRCRFFCCFRGAMDLELVMWLNPYSSYKMSSHPISKREYRPCDLRAILILSSPDLSR